MFCVYTAILVRTHSRFCFFITCTSLADFFLHPQRVATPDSEQQDLSDPVYDESLWDAIDPELREWTLEKLVHHRLELEHFKNYLAENYASMDLMCWMDIEAFRRSVRVVSQGCPSGLSVSVVIKCVCRSIM